MDEKGEGTSDFLHLKKTKLVPCIDLIYRMLRVKARVKAAKSRK